MTALVRDAAGLLAEAIIRRGEGVAVVGAHPDDETYGCGGELGELPEARVVIVTDGAPRDLSDAHKVGFETAEDYAAARHGEVIAALREAGLAPDRLTTLDYPDQQAVFHLAEIARTLTALFANWRTELVFTHAYEGGHPDHDAVAFAVREAAAILKRQGRAPVILEMPFYRVGEDGGVVQGFVPAPGGAAYETELDDSHFALKNRMMARHASQARLFGGTGLRSRMERFRIAPDYDFRNAPNGGRLLYEAWHLNVTGETWLAEAARALAELGR